MGGKKGHSGRPRKYQSHPYLDQTRRLALEWYHKNRERQLEVRREYHKRIKTYADAHGISFEEARKIVGNPKKKKEETSTK